MKVVRQNDKGVYMKGFIPPRFPHSVAQNVDFGN